MDGVVGNMKIVATIEARMKSSRLPGKVLRPILGRPMLELLVERVRRAKKVDEVVIATVADSSCDPIVEMAQKNGISFFRGSEDDVLDRVLQAALHASADTIVELTGDNPLVDPGIIDRTIECYLESKADYCSSHLNRHLPLGMDVQVFSTAVLKKVSTLTNAQRDREHVSLFIYEHPELFKLVKFESGLKGDYSSLRLTVDTKEDFLLASDIFMELYGRNPVFTLVDILALLKSKPGLFERNKQVVQKKA
ncbi:MAG: glycosyltransferase family protein [Fibrobacterota bacterium]